MKKPMFGEVAAEWYARWSVQREPSYAVESWRQLEREALPWLGRTPIHKINAPQILEVLRRIEARGVRVPVSKVRGHISQIYRYAIACELIAALVRFRAAKPGGQRLADLFRLQSIRFPVKQ